MERLNSQVRSRTEELDGANSHIEKLNAMLEHVQSDLSDSRIKLHSNDQQYTLTISSLAHERDVHVTELAQLRNLMQSGTGLRDIGATSYKVQIDALKTTLQVRGAYVLPAI